VKQELRIRFLKQNYVIPEFKDKNINSLVRLNY